MNRTDKWIKGAMGATVVGVAGIAAYISYRHAYSVVLAHGEGTDTAAMVPLTVDGAVFASSMVMLHSARRQTRTPPLAYVMLGLGVVATLSANVLHGLSHGPVGAVIAAWPAVALVGIYELLMMVIRSGRTLESVPEMVTQSAPESVPGLDRTGVGLDTDSETDWADSPSSAGYNDLSAAREVDRIHRAQHGRPASAETIRRTLAIGASRARDLRDVIRSDSGPIESDNVIQLAN